MSYIIRTSDRKQFKQCRQAWDFGSKIRQNFEPNREDTNLSFGTAIHAGLEAYYDPKTWGHREVQEVSALQAFFAAWQEYFISSEDDYEVNEKWKELKELGHGMLDYYFEWAPKFDNFTPKFVEIEFEVPILADRRFIDYPFQVIDNQLHYRPGAEPTPIFYQGRIDLLLEDEHGSLWIADHKTAAKLDPTDFLDMDEQTGSYCWAIQQMLGVKVEGVIYNELVKAVPHEPKKLKSGKFSVDKSQSVTAKTYKEALDKDGQSVVEYQDFLDWLENNERQYVRRTTVHRSQKELELLGERICLEAIDMLNYPSIYPNPDRFKCGRCSFRIPCLARMDGSDYEYLLSNNFHIRTMD